jgi:hypothetical protein
MVIFIRAAESAKDPGMSLQRMCGTSVGNTPGTKERARAGSVVEHLPGPGELWDPAWELKNKKVRNHELGSIRAQLTQHCPGDSHQANLQIKSNEKVQRHIFRNFKDWFENSYEK